MDLAKSQGQIKYHLLFYNRTQGRPRTKGRYHRVNGNQSLEYGSIHRIKRVNIRNFLSRGDYESVANYRCRLRCTDKFGN